VDSEDLAPKELQNEFRRSFGAEWGEVLDVVDPSFAYNAANNAYFSVRDIHPLAEMTLEELLAKETLSQPANIIVS
jgi:hypothetical protein